MSLNFLRSPRLSSPVVSWTCLWGSHDGPVNKPQRYSLLSPPLLQTTTCLFPAPRRKTHYAPEKSAVGTFHEGQMAPPELSSQYLTLDYCTALSTGAPPRDPQPKPAERPLLTELREGHFINIELQVHRVTHEHILALTDKTGIPLPIPSKPVPSSSSLTRGDHIHLLRCILPGIFRCIYVIHMSYRNIQEICRKSS